MSGKATTPIEESRGIPIRTLRVTVTAGADTGQTVEADSESLTIGTADGNVLVLTDPTVSRYHLELSRTPDGVRVLDHGSTNGTVVNGVAVERGMVAAGATLQLGRTRVRVEDGGGATVPLHPDEKLAELRGRSRSMRRLMARIAKAAPAGVAVLLVGESGTGKELIARALHDLGDRRTGPFEVVDCGSLAPQLVASELFGHDKGAFTGAERRHIGAFERAHGGTLFLDEVGELPPDLQPMLLGALERRRFRRVGGSEPVEVDVRLVSATNRDLRAEINRGAFRLDLYYRLAILSLDVPPLRERTDDVPLLVEHFLRQAGFDGDPADVFPPSTLDALSAHHWPGNVRELRNVVEATLAMGEAPSFEGAPALDETEPADPNAIPIARYLHMAYKDARSGVLSQFEKRYLARLLETADGNVARAAREARMDRSYLFSLLKRHGLR